MYKIKLSPLKLYCLGYYQVLRGAYKLLVLYYARYVFMHVHT